MQRADLFEKTLMLGKIEGGRRLGRQRMSWLEGITDSADMSLGKVQEMVMDRMAWRPVVHGIAKSRTWLNNWTELNWINSERIFLVYFLVCNAWHIISIQQTLIEWIMLSQQRPFFFFFFKAPYIATTNQKISPGDTMVYWRKQRLTKLTVWNYRQSYNLKSADYSATASWKAAKMSIEINPEC